jgi:hypothetical protein
MIYFNTYLLTPWSLVRERTIPTERRNLVPTFVDRGVSRSERGGFPTINFNTDKYIFVRFGAY